MRVWVLGAGTLLPHPWRGSPGYWIETQEERILLDCGAGTLRTLAKTGRPWSLLTHLLVTHFHTDHVGELAPLLFALRHGPRPPRSAPLHLLGPQGLNEHLHALARAHGSYITDPGFPLAVEELDPERAWISESGTLRVRSMRTLHTEEALAFRLETPGSSVGFTGDTGPREGLGRFLRGCHLLVAECSHPDGEGTENHLTPSGLAALATDAKPDLLLTVHAYPPLEPEGIPDLLRGRGYRGRVLPGRDEMEIRISSDGCRVMVPGLGV